MEDYIGALENFEEEAKAVEVIRKNPKMLADAQRNARALSTPSEEKGWARFSLSFLGELPHRLGDSLDSYIIRLTYNDRETQTTRIVDVDVLDGTSRIDDEWALKVDLVDSEAKSIGEPFYVRYEDIIDIGIY